MIFFLNYQACYRTTKVQMSVNNSKMNDCKCDGKTLTFFKGVPSGSTINKFLIFKHNNINDSWSSLEMSRTRSTALERLVMTFLGGLNQFYGIPTLALGPGKSFV